MGQRQLQVGKIEKVDATLGVVFGWAIICKEGGEPYYDLHGHHIPEEEMLKAAVSFGTDSRVTKDMHRTIDRPMPFLFPVTEEVAKAYGFTTSRTGLMVGIRPSKQVLQKFVDGTYTGFSIGGSAEVQYEDDD